MELLDFGAIARSGMAQVPDYAAQQAQEQQLALRQSQQQLAQQAQLMKQQEDQREQDEAARYQADLANYFETGDIQDLIKLQAKYPKQSEAIKRAIDSQDKAKTDADRRQAADIHSYISNNRPDLAAKSLRERLAKERQAGQPDDENDLEVLAMLESGDAAQIKQAQGIVAYQLALTGDDFGKTLKDIRGDEKSSPFLREYQDRVATFGQAAADAWAQTQDNKDRALIVPNKGIYDARTVFGGGGDVTEGGGQASGGGAAPATSAAPTDIVKDGRTAIQSIFPGITVTDNVRDPNSALGKKNPNSFHVKTGGAVDVKPIPGLTFPQFINKIKSAGYKIAEAKNEVGAGRSKWATGDHWHVVLSGGPGFPARVKTKQQFEKLPSGTVFIAPDGSRRVKP